MKKILLVALGATVSSFGYCQFGNAFYQNEAPDINSGSVVILGTPVLNTTATLAGGVGNVTTEGRVSWEMNSFSGEVVIRQRFGFEIGNTPILFSNLRRNLNGKVVLSGGQPGARITDLTVSTSLGLFWFNDSNNNTTWELGETQQGLTGVFAEPLLVLTQNSFQGYNDPEPYNFPNYILSPHQHYFFEHTIRTTWFGGTNNGNPPWVATLEYDSPFTGHQSFFDYQAVPEPGTIVVLGLAGLAALRKRRK